MGILPSVIFLEHEVDYFKSRLNIYYCNLNDQIGSGPIHVGPQKFLCYD